MEIEKRQRRYWASHTNSAFHKGQKIKRKTIRCQRWQWLNPIRIFYYYVAVGTRDVDVCLYGSLSKARQENCSMNGWWWSQGADSRAVLFVRRTFNPGPMSAIITNVVWSNACFLILTSEIQIKRDTWACVCASQYYAHAAVYHPFPPFSEASGSDEYWWLGLSLRASAGRKVTWDGNPGTCTCSHSWKQRDTRFF